MALSQALPGRRLSQHCVRACGGHAMIDGNTARRQHPCYRRFRAADSANTCSDIEHDTEENTRTRARAKRALSTAPDSSAASPRRTRPCCASARRHTERVVYCTAQCRSGGVCVEPAAPEARSKLYQVSSQVPFCVSHKAPLLRFRSRPPPSNPKPSTLNPLLRSASATAARQT